VRRGSLLDPRPLRRFLERRLDWDGSHDFDIAPVVDASAQEAASLDEWRSLRRG
jgi:hypothetical protein